MSGKSTSSFLESSVDLLVQHFGVDRVQDALAKASTATKRGQQPTLEQSRARHHDNRSITSTLELLRETDEEKHKLLSEFYTILRDGKVLPESQDIRHFAQLIGLKEIEGKSRKAMIPRLIRFLLTQPTDRLHDNLRMASSVSEEQRSQGFSKLTHKLLGEV